MSETIEKIHPGDPNKKDFPYLYTLKPLYEKAGIQFDQMMEIVALKAKILGRTEQAQIANAKRKKKGHSGDSAVSSAKDASFFSWGKAISYLITSAFLMLYGFIFNNPSTMLSITFTVGFVMQFLAIVTTFPVLILDTKDFTILTTKPINTKTISAAKTTIATLYMICTSGTIYGLTFIPFMFKGLWTILPFMLFAVIVSNLICVALSYLLYGIILKFYDGEKLKDILSVFQIVLTIFIMVGYQLIAQLQNIVDTAAAVSFAWWHLLVPPLWLSNFSGMLISPKHLIPGLLSLALILGLMVLHFCFTGKMLEDNLSKMMNEGEVKRGSYSLKLTIQEKIAKLIYKDNQDRAFFLLGYSVTSNDRKMKQVIYPMYVAMLILPAIMVFNAWSDKQQPLKLVFQENSWLFFTLYFAGLTIGSIVMYTKRTEKPTGSWIFDTLPVNSQTRAFKAVALNLILRYVLLPMLLCVGVFLYFMGLNYLVDLLVVLAFTLLVAIGTLKSEKVDWPFSYELTYAEGKKGLLILINLIAIAFFVGIHALCHYFYGAVAVPILLVLTSIAAVVVWRKI